MMLTEEKLKETKLQQEEPVLLKEPEKKPRKGYGWFWLLVFSAAAVLFVMKSTSRVEIIGGLKAKQFVSLELEIPGTLKEVIRRKGDVVKAGDILAKFINPTLIQDLFLKTKSLEIAQDELQALQKQQETLKVRLEKEAMLLENGVISNVEFQEFQDKAYLLQKKIDIELKVIEKLKSEIVFIEQTIAKLDLKAPFDGMILDDPARNIGGSFKEGQTAFVIADPSTFYLEAPLREFQARKIHAGDIAVVRFDADPARVFEGEVVNLSVRTYKQVEKVFKVKHVVMCEIRINAMPSDLRYGMQARITILSSIIPGQNWNPTKIKKENLDLDGIIKH